MTEYLKKYLSSCNENERTTAAIAYLAALDHIASDNPEVCHAITQELKDQRSHLKLIASENFSSLAVQLAMGNLLTDKYAEGFAFHRFYAGCDNVDAVESLAQKELCDLFGCDHAYVQPHSGADANLIAFWSILSDKVQIPFIEKLGRKNLDALTNEEHEELRTLMNAQRLMGMSLNSGGHLTHGYRHNVSSKMFQSFVYDVDFDTGVLDYGAIQRQAKEIRPLILLAGYSAYPRLINFAKMREIADSVGAVLMVDMAHFAGLVAGKALKGEHNPVPYAHIVTSTTHKTLRGPRGGIILCQKEFADTVNKGCPMVMGGPLPHVIAAKAIAFKEANTPNFCDYAARVITNAKALAEGLMKRGIDILTNGTDNHIVILNLSSLGITGRQAEKALREAKLTVNRNAIPNDANGPWYTSGVRVGTPAMTTLGMGVNEMDEIADIISVALKGTKPSIVEKTGELSKANYVMEEGVIAEVQGRVKSLLEQFPLYPELCIEDTTTTKV